MRCPGLYMGNDAPAGEHIWGSILIRVHHVQSAQSQYLCALAVGFPMGEWAWHIFSLSFTDTLVKSQVLIT